MGVWVWQVPGPCTVGNMRHSTPDPDTTWPFVEKVPDKFHACMQVPCYACVPRCFFLEVCGLQCSLVLLILAAMAHQKREREAKEIGRDLGVYQWSLGCHAHFEFLFFAWYCQMTSALCSAETGDILNMNLGWIGIKIMGSVVQSQMYPPRAGRSEIVPRIVCFR